MLEVDKQPDEKACPLAGWGNRLAIHTGSHRSRSCHKKRRVAAEQMVCRHDKIDEFDLKCSLDKATILAYHILT